MGEREGAGAASARAARGSDRRCSTTTRELSTAAYREVAAGSTQGTEVTVDDDGKLHISALEAIPDPPSLTQLRKLVQAMLPGSGCRR